MTDPAFSDRQPPPAPSRCKCLIIEDNPFAADIMSIFFERNGIESDSAVDGQAGLQKYLDAPEAYDVIFLDLQMPLLDGYEVARQIRQSDASTAQSIPLVAMSGSNTGDIIRRSGFTYFLNKPFELHSLLTVISEVVQM